MWNVRSKGLGQAEDLVAAISRLRRWDSSCLQEVAREGEEVVGDLEGDTYCMSRLATKAQVGWHRGPCRLAMFCVILSIRATMLLGGLADGHLRGTEADGRRERALSPRQPAGRGVRGGFRRLGPGHDPWAKSCPNMGSR